LKKIANVSFLSNLAGLCDLYRLIGSLCGSLQTVNLFLWERLELVKDGLRKMEQMSEALKPGNEDKFKGLWPVSAEYWPKLEDNSFVGGIPYLEPDRVESYFTRRQFEALTSPADSPISTTRDNLMKYIDLAIPLFTKRLLENDEEINLAFHTSVLTNLKPLISLASTHEVETFVLRAMENQDFVASCRYTTFLEEEITDQILSVQIRTFLKRLHPLLLNAEEKDSRRILKEFLVIPSLFDGIPDLLHCLLTCFMIGHNESYVESMGSVLTNHFPPNRNLTLENLEQEVIIAWNGPSIPNCDDVVKRTIDRMHGAGQ
jgi:hypothetical protein